MEKVINKFFSYREEKSIDEIEKDMALLKNSLKSINQDEITELIRKHTRRTGWFKRKAKIKYR